MADRFLAQPEILKAKGNSVNDESQEFGQNVNKVYSTVEEMLASSYISPGARAIGAKIQSYKDDMDGMTRVINEYGNHLLLASNTVVRNEQNIMDSVNRNTTAL